MTSTELPDATMQVKHISENQTEDNQNILETAAAVFEAAIQNVSKDSTTTSPPPPPPPPSHQDLSIILMDNKTTSDKEEEPSSSAPGPGPVMVPPAPERLSCILCMECIGDRNSLQSHLVKNHEVRTEALHKFMSLVDFSDKELLPRIESMEEETAKPNCVTQVNALSRSESVVSPFEESDSLVIDFGDMEESGKMDENMEVEGHLDSGCTAASVISEEQLSSNQSALNATLKPKDMVESAVLDGKIACSNSNCKEVFPEFESLFRHQEELGHLKQRQTATGVYYSCWHPGCDDTFPSASEVQLHFRHQHANTHSSMTSSMTENEDLKCRQCDQVFKKREEYKMHQYCHEMEKAMECSGCGKRFKSIIEFRKHKQAVHNEDLTLEQEELYEASLAAASSLALLGASGLEYVSLHVPKGHLGKEKDLGTEGFGKLDGRLDENSNSCLLAKFEGNVLTKGGMIAEMKNQKQGCQDCMEGSQNGLMRKCHSCSIGLRRENGLTENEVAEKHKRKKSRPSKVVCDSLKQKPIGYSSKSNMMESTVLDLTSGSGSGRNGPSTPQVNSQLRPGNSSTTIPFVSPSIPQQRHPLLPVPAASTPPVSQFSRAADRPFRCSVCKVSYSQKNQLDSHLASQQHISRCSKASESSTRQQMAPGTFPGDYNEQVLELLRQQQNLPVPSFMPFGIPLMGQFMSPLAPYYPIPPVPTPGIEPNTISSISLKSSSIPKTSSSRSTPMDATQKPDSTPKSQHSSDSGEKTDLTSSRRKALPSAELQNKKQQEQESMEPVLNILAPDPQSTKYNQTMMDSILQRIGYECVKQFNEFRQKPKLGSDSISLESNQSQTEDSESNDVEILHERCVPEGEVTAVKESCSEKASKKSKNVYVCSTCLKRFSSIFVLKAHQEEVHKEIIPIDVLERLQGDLKANYESARRQGENEEGKVATEKGQGQGRSGGGKREDPVRSVPKLEEEELKLKQQLQLAAAFQTMQLNLMMTMGMIPQVFPRLPGPSHMPPIAPELFQQQPFPVIDPMLMMQIQQQQQQQQQQSKTVSSAAHPVVASTQPSATMSNQKSARTRITEQQLQILRANFDINNSPTEEQIQEMSEKTGLVTKVIKHWFRNTLFKERQRNKDSPYNFSVPPATTLNLEEYERNQKPFVKKETKSAVEEISQSAASISSDATVSSPIQERTRALDLPEKTVLGFESSLAKSESGILELPSAGDGGKTSFGMRSSQPEISEFGSGRFDLNLNPVAGNINNFYNLSPPSTWQERRAGRTRFSNHQVQVLQEFFDRNPYPKDDEVESLSQALGLGVRVIVVWFQNARQRVRKIEGHASSENSKQVDLLQHQMAECDGNDLSSATSESNEVHDEEQGSRSSHGNENEGESLNQRNLMGGRLECDKCDMTYEFVSQLHEHQRDVHSCEPSGSQQGSSARNLKDFGQKALDLGRKTADDGSVCRQSSDDEEHRSDRRMRTTLAQDQLDYLYQKFALESNPSRPALEEIAAHLNLKPRVVQVWFQNTRARERRGQHRVNAQKSLVRCVFCDAVFRGKMGLNAHIAEHHPQQANSLVLPVNLARTVQTIPSGIESTITPFLPPTPLMPSPGLNLSLQSNMHYLYEKSFKQYMAKLSNLQTTPQSPSSSISNHSFRSNPTTVEASKPTTSKTEEGPLDLTTSSLVPRNENMNINEKMETSNRNLFQQNLDDSYSETFSENDDVGMGDCASPSSLSANPSQRNSMFSVGKRYRTQMSSLQIKVMRAIFSEYKTPSLAECEILGEQIGLAKRVVQVWFQNSRAKEKKSSFPGMEKTEGNSSSSSSFPNLSNSPTDCRFCNTVYTANHTLQDHLFTKMHIERVKTFMSSNEFGKSYSNSYHGDTDTFIPQKLSAASVFPLNQSMTTPNALISPGSLESIAGIHNSTAKHIDRADRKQKLPHETPPKIVKEQTNDRGQVPTTLPVTNSIEANMRQFVTVTPSAAAAAADLMGVMMPYLYPAGGIPPLFPGVAPIQLLQQNPNALPGIANAIFNPAMCGIQLIQLQIPRRAIEQIQERLKDRGCTKTHYSDDCLTTAESKHHLSSDEYNWLAERTIHVGYICKKCHMVFPQADACTAHQVAVCCKDVDKAGSFGDSVLKLEQLIYQCSLCKVNYSTVAEYKTHCGQEKHRRLATTEAGTSNGCVGNRNEQNPKWLTESVSGIKVEKEDA